MKSLFFISWFSASCSGFTAHVRENGRRQHLSRFGEILTCDTGRRHSCKERLGYTTLGASLNGDDAQSTKTEKALLGMGCFWAPQEEFAKIPGIVKVTTGYALASPIQEEADDTSTTTMPAPSYFSVCNGDGRTEAILLEYDPNVISFQGILRNFWQGHNAAAQQLTPEKQLQYASVIWPLSQEQMDVAKEDLEKAKKVYKEAGFGQPKTIISNNVLAQGNTLLTLFSPAETIHQNFWTKLKVKLGVIMAVSVLSSYGFMEEGLASYGLRAVFLWVFWETVELAAFALGSLGLAKPTTSQEETIVSSSKS